MYAKRYTDENTFQVIQYYNGGSRIIANDQHDYLAWLDAGGVPVIEAAGRFLSVVNNQLVVDPNKTSILAAEAAAAQAESDRVAAKAQAIADNLPSWAAVETAINSATTITQLRPIILKLARVLYWEVKNKVD